MAEPVWSGCACVATSITGFLVIDATTLSRSATFVPASMSTALLFPSTRYMLSFAIMWPLPIQVCSSIWRNTTSSLLATTLPSIARAGLAGGFGAACPFGPPGPAGAAGGGPKGTVGDGDWARNAPEQRAPEQKAISRALTANFIKAVLVDRN